MLKALSLILFYCLHAQSATVVEENANQLNLGWRVGGRIGNMNRFIRRDLTDWKVKSSHAMTVGLDRIVKLDSFVGFRWHYGAEINSIYQVAEFEKTEMKTSGITLNIPLGVGYAFSNDEWEVGVRLNTPVASLKAVQADFSTKNYSKSIKTIQPVSLLRFEAFAEYQFSKELSYNLSYNFDYSAFYWGGINYAF